MSSESGHDIVLTTIDEKYNINLSQIYTGSFEVEQAKWTYNHVAQTVTNGTLTLNIGDYINDTETNVEGFDGKWRVLGEDNGKLLLVTATCWAPFEGSDIPYGGSYNALRLEGLDGWNNGIKELNDIGNLYESSKLENGRSIKVEDVNKITGYNPNNIGVNDLDETKIGTPYGNGTISQYKNNVTFTIKSEKVWYVGDKSIKTETQSNCSDFKILGESNNISQPYVIENDYYKYYPSTLSETDDSGANIGIANSSPAFDMLFKVPGPPYWLASKCKGADDDIKGSAEWGLRTCTYRKC